MTPEQFGAALLLLGFDYYHATHLHYTHRYGIGQPTMEIVFTEGWDEVCWSGGFTWAKQFMPKGLLEAVAAFNSGTMVGHYAPTTPDNLRNLLCLIAGEEKAGVITTPERELN